MEQKQSSPPPIYVSIDLWHIDLLDLNGIKKCFYSSGADESMGVVRGDASWKKKSSTYLQTANFDFDTCGQHTRATLNGLGLRLLHVLQCTMENDAIYGNKGQRNTVVLLERSNVGG